MKIIQGDILDIKKGVIVHQVNCQNKMGSGIAKALYTKYPIVKEKYHKHMNVGYGMKFIDKSFLGLISLVEITSRELYIVNLFGQLYYGKNKNIVYTDYDAFKKGITTLITDYIQKITIFKNLPIYLPYKIGCGLANGDWNIIVSILEELEKEYNIEFNIIKKE